MTILKKDASEEEIRNFDWHGYVQCRYCGFHFISYKELNRHMSGDCCEVKAVVDVIFRMTGHYPKSFNKIRYTEEDE